MLRLRINGEMCSHMPERNRITFHLTRKNLYLFWDPKKQRTRCNITLGDEPEAVLRDRLEEFLYLRYPKFSTSEENPVLYCLGKMANSCIDVEVTIKDYGTSRVMYSLSSREQKQHMPEIMKYYQDWVFSGAQPGQQMPLKEEKEDAY